MTTRIQMCLAQIVLVVAVAICTFATLQADEGEPQAGAAASTDKPVDALGDQQGRIAKKYKELEALLLKMSDIEKAENPQRAKLLLEVYDHGQKSHIHSQLGEAAKLLEQDRLKQALDGQTQVRNELKNLLELLQKEDRARRTASEQQRIKGYIKELDRLIKKERSLQGRTEGDSDAKELAQDQKDIASRAGELANDIRKNEEGEPTGEKSNEQKSGEQGSKQPTADQEPSEGNSGEKNPDEEPTPGEERPSPPKEGESQPQDASPEGAEGEQPDSSSKQQPSQGQPPQGQQPSTPESENESSESEEQSQPEAQKNENPARKRIEAAQEKMRNAQKRLEESKKTEAVKEQEDARRLLEQAKAELEEILRQLREEEIERVLAQLESRFRAMLRMQLLVYEETKRLDKAQAEGVDPSIDARAGKLSFEQKKIVIEADKALTLLKEEGSSIAFPEVIEQMRDDMAQVAERLAAVKVGQVTISLEEDVIATLEEMIEALQKAQKEQEDRQKQQQQQQQAGEPQDPGLVDMIAELRMIRALQMRVNQRTRRYAEFLEHPDDLIGQATETELQEALGKLAEREESCQRITRDIVLGKNQ